MLDFVICDDNKHSLNRLNKMLNSIFILKDIDAKISLSTNNPNELIEYLNNNSADVLFLDIDLKSNINGLEVANLIRKKNKDIYIIFTTAHLEYGLIAYKFKTFDYLSKPITQERLENTVDRLLEDLNFDNSSFLRLDNNKTIIKENSIQYIKKDGMKVVIHTDTRDYESYSSFKKIIPMLSSDFIQCHKSYIVNLNKITNIDMVKSSITLENNDDSTCYIGPKYKEHFMEVFNNAHL